MDFLIVGAGLSGSTCARLLAEWGYKVLVIERRNHVAGNCHDAFYVIGNENKSVPYHVYGPHFFHTNNDDVCNFVCRFSNITIPYIHKAKIELSDRTVNFPPTHVTLLQLNINQKDIPVASTLFNEEEAFQQSPNAEVYLSKTIGPELRDLLYRVYTERHWGKTLDQLPAHIVRRVKFTDIDQYFKDKHQFLPAIGYTSFVKNVLNHENISLILNFDFLKYRSLLNLNNIHIIYTGKIDSYFDYKHGELEYISVKTLKEVHNFRKDISKNCVQLNFGIPIRYSRVVNYSQLANIYPDGKELLIYEEPIHGQNKDTYDSFIGYPIPTMNNINKLNLYLDDAKQINNLTLVGRLAEYRYLNMDQAIENAMKICQAWKP